MIELYVILIKKYGEEKKRGILPSIILNINLF